MKGIPLRWVGLIGLMALPSLVRAAEAPPPRTFPEASFQRDRGDVIRRVVPSTVQLRSEREYGVRRAASGVVLAADPSGPRSWVVTTRHFLEPPEGQEVHLSVAGRSAAIKARLSALSADADLALLEVDGVALPPVALKTESRLGDSVWVVAFPRGRRMTVASGIVSQLVSDETFEGAASMVDASVSYGASGGGVYDAESGELVGIVEGYRTGRVKLQDSPEVAVDIPLPGETTLISSQDILRFVRTLGLDVLVAR